VPSDLNNEPDLNARSDLPALPTPPTLPEPSDQCVQSLVRGLSVIRALCLGWKRGTR